MSLSNLHHHNLPISHFKPPPFLIKLCIFKSFPNGISHSLRTRTIYGQVILPEAFITAPNSVMAPAWKFTSRVITVRILIIWPPTITIKLHLLACSSKVCQIHRLARTPLCVSWLFIVVLNYLPWQIKEGEDSFWLTVSEITGHSLRCHWILGQW